MGLDDRDNANREHYPSCTCVACYRRRSEKAAETWCSRHNRPKGPSGCEICLLEGRSDGSPGNGGGNQPQSQLAGKGVLRQGTPGAADTGQSENRLGKTLRGILGKRGSA